MRTRRESNTVSPPNIARTRLTVGSTKRSRSVGRAITAMCMSSTRRVIAASWQTRERARRSVERLEHVRLDGGPLVLQGARPEVSHARARQAAQRPRPGRDPADRRGALQPRRDVHGVADDRGALAARADDPDHGLAAVDLDTEPRPV